MDFAAELAVTLATKGAEALVAGGTSAVRALVDAIRRRFGRGTRESAALTACLEGRDAPQVRAELAAALAEAMVREPAFADELRRLWPAASVELAADHGSVVNQFDGQARTVIQARDITNITF